jgi:hypothetical protein
VTLRNITCSKNNQISRAIQLIRILSCPPEKCYCSGKC